MLAIIPARGGSKGVPRKNVRLIAGKPLIVWTIETALQAEAISRVIVSTDDEEIAQVAQAAGAEVIMRPAELAQDTTPTEPALLHVLDTLQQTEGWIPEAVVLLQCTSPLRGPQIVNECTTLLRDTGCDAVLTVTPMQHWYLAGTVNAENIYAPEYDYYNRPRSQDMPEKVRENGAVYVTRTTVMQQMKNRLGGAVRAVVMDPVRSVDIDNEEDFILAEEILLALRK